MELKISNRISNKKFFVGKMNTFSIVCVNRNKKVKGNT